MTYIEKEKRTQGEICQDLALLKGRLVYEEVRAHGACDAAIYAFNLFHIDLSMHRKKFFSDTAKSQCPLLFRSRAIVHNFLFSLHKRWRARIYSERNSSCLLCYIKPEMKKNRIERGRCLNTTQEWCLLAATLKLLFIFIFFTLLSIFG